MQPGEPSIGDRPYFAARLLGNYLQWARGFEEGLRDGDVTALGCQIDAHKERRGAPCSTEEILVARCFNLEEEEKKNMRDLNAGWHIHVVGAEQLQNIAKPIVSSFVSIPTF